jgi:hypothetical protein
MAFRIAGEATHHEGIGDFYWPIALALAIPEALAIENKALGQKRALPDVPDMKSSTAAILSMGAFI